MSFSGFSVISLFSDWLSICWIWFVYESHTKSYIYTCFGIILTQFYINFSRQEHRIELLYVSINSWDSQISAYTPFHFSFTVPLSLLISLICIWCQKDFSLCQNTNSNFLIPSSLQANVVDLWNFKFWNIKK